jgi:hypothetical protein
MLSVYTNQNQLLNSTSTVSVERLDTVDSQLLDNRAYAITLKEGANPNLELHAYTPDGVYLTGNHKALYSVESNSDVSGSVAYKHLAVDIATELETIGINRGQYKLVTNFYDNILGSYESEKLFIKEISPSRQEIRLNLSSNSPELLTQYVNFRDRIVELNKNDVFDSFVLNFGFNETYQIVNVITNQVKNYVEILVKLYKPLPEQYVEKAKVWISEEIIKSVSDSISIYPKSVAETTNTLAGPNFDIDEFEKSSVATDFKSWNDLLSSNVQTSQQIVDNYFSGSLSGIKLNINYRLFDNFVHYSSATERVKNFKYKLELIEYYTGQIKTIIQLSSSVAVNTNLLDLQTKRNRVVSGFDDFEKYLFFESGDTKLYTNYDTTGSIDPWPKINPVSMVWSEAFTLWSTATSTWATSTYPTAILEDYDPYGYFLNQVKTTSTEGETYYESLLALADDYDRNNVHALKGAVPTYILETDAADDFLLFVNMLGQHYDILWTYINNLTTINKREEHPKDGMPDDLLYHVAKSYGFELLNGRSTSELWNYALGTDVSGSALQNNNNGITSLSDKSNTVEIWRRIVNNLPYILKTKGTSRSVKALLSCFGIPSTILTIKEYGGPSTFTDNDHYPEYVHDVFHYAWLSETGSINFTIGNYLNGAGSSVNANTLEFRFKTDNNYTYSVNSPYTVVSSSNGRILTLTKTSDGYGTLTYGSASVSASIAGLNIFDDSWHSVAINQVNGTGSFKVAKSLYGKTIYIQSASVTPYTLPAFAETMSFAPASNKFYGQFHELRLWSGSLNDATLAEHAASPSTYTYNVDRTNLTAGEEAGKPYTHLLQRYTLANTQILTGSIGLYQNSIHPNQTINVGNILFTNFPDSSSIQFEAFEETYYTPSPSLGNNSLYTNKVRIESASLDPNKRLNTKTRIEKSSYDRYSLDSNKVGIYFSPQNAINEDIFNQLGYFEIDDYIGDPSDVNNSTYSGLTTFSSAYWKKYLGKSNFEAYFRTLELYDFTLFKYIKRLLPFRANALTGLTLEPNVLERSKIKVTNNPVIEDLLKNANFNAVEDVITSAIFDADKTALFTDTQPEVAGIYDNIGLGLVDNIVDTDRLGTAWVQHRFIGKYKITESGSYEPIQTVVLNSRLSDYLEMVGDYYYSSSLSASLGLYYSASYTKADITRTNGIGYFNARYNGCKLIGSAINIDSANTIDGGPVVKVTVVSPNQLVFANNQITTLDKSVTGNVNQSISANKPVVNTPQSNS